MERANIKKQQVTSFLEIHECTKTGYKSLYVSKELKPFTVLSNFSHDNILTAPTRFTIQVSENQHIRLKPTYLQYVNHSCNPNVFFDTRIMMLSTVRHIQCGEEVVFFYPSTEWKMTEAFDCSCGNDNCLGHIKGAAHLGYDNLSKYRLSDYMIHKYGRLAELQHQNFTKFNPTRKLELFNRSMVAT